ncbi:MAG: DUF2089 family protein [Planctomycetota bacterium]
MRPSLSRCPACDRELSVRRYRCGGCGTEIEGDFTAAPLLHVEERDREMLMMFLKTRGNLSEVAKTLGVSYPTAKIRFEEFLVRTGIRTEEEREAGTSDVLERLEKGEISPAAATEEIRRLKPG